MSTEVSQQLHCFIKICNRIGGVDFNSSLLMKVEIVFVCVCFMQQQQICDNSFLMLSFGTNNRGVVITDSHMQLTHICMVKLIYSFVARKMPIFVFFFLQILICNLTERNSSHKICRNPYQKKVTICSRTCTCTRTYESADIE